MKPKLLIALAALFILVSCGQSSIPYNQSNAKVTSSQYFSAIQNDQEKLSSFLRLMPKGADLHNHLAGSVFPEKLIDLGIKEKACYNGNDFTITLEPCNIAKSEIPMSELQNDKENYEQMIDALSMRNFRPGIESGHAHFFNTFNKNNAITRLPYFDELLTEIKKEAHKDNILYLELMFSLQGKALGELAQTLKPESNFRQKHEQLIQGDLGSIVRAGQKDIDSFEGDTISSLNCTTLKADSACRVMTRYIIQVNRLLPLDDFFTRLLFAAELAKTDKRVVGINLVAPEDNETAVKNYQKHMEMLNFIYSTYPTINISLHAGELTPELVSKEVLTSSHIDQAITTGHAKRIGHGVDILFEATPEATIEKMVQKNIAVEVNLTSNEQILGIAEEAHPFMTYLEHKVPIVISTDDPGISRITLTDEFVKAIQRYHISYDKLKEIIRNSLEYSFLPGQSLWEDRTSLTPASFCDSIPLGSSTQNTECQFFLDQSEKANLQWKLEHDLSIFDQRMWEVP